MSDDSKHLLVGVGKQILSGLVGAIVAAFLLGGARQKIVTLNKEWETWNTAWNSHHAPRIERMDSQGTTSFQFWKGSYEKEQAQQYDRIKKLEEEVSHLETMTLRIDRLEKNHNPKPE
jgi:hypothetical protein